MTLFGLLLYQQIYLILILLAILVGGLGALGLYYLCSNGSHKNHHTRRHYQRRYYRD